MNMKLPERHEKKNTLENMKDYSSGYTVPRAMRVDKEGNCYLNEGYSFEEKTWWTVQLKITKVPEWYIVHIDEMKDDYTREKRGASWFSLDVEKCYGKVVASSMDDYSKKYNVPSHKSIPDIKKGAESKYKKTIKDLVDNIRKGLLKN